LGKPKHPGARVALAFEKTGKVPDVARDYRGGMLVRPFTYKVVLGAGQEGVDHVVDIVASID
jgi:hypothetical protein